MKPITKLHDTLGKRTPSGGSIYCGPTAIMAITGRDYPEVRAVANQFRGMKPTMAIRGLSTSNLKAVLYHFGYMAIPVPKRDDFDYKGKTIARFLRERPDDLRNECLILCTRDHFVVVKGRKFMDNYTQQPVWTSKAPHRRARVKLFMIVKKL